MITNATIKNLLAPSGTGGAALKFPTVGTTYEGVVTSCVEVPKKVFGKDQIQLGKNGQPETQICINLDIEGEERSLWPKTQMLGALYESLGTNDIEVGGRIKVAFVAEKPNTNPALNAQKIYKVRYTPPASGTELSELPGDEPF